MTPEECKPEYNTGILNDERFQQVKSWSTDEYTAQDENGILQKLTSLPQYDYQVGGTQIKRQNWYYLWTRPTIGWDLNCEL